MVFASVYVSLLKMLTCLFVFFRIFFASTETQEPYAIAVLLQYDLVLIDLLTPGFPCFESPYPMDLHESPVTYCTYLTDCPSDLVPAFYSVSRLAINIHSCNIRFIFSVPSM